MTIAARPLPARALPAQRAARPDAQARAANAALFGRRDVGASAALFTFTLDAPISGFRAGQYVALGVWCEGTLVQRPYSVVSVGDEGRRIELLVRQVQGGTLSPRLWQMPIGGRVRMGPPRGLFLMDHDDRRDHLFVGAGTGVAPLLAMLEEAATHPASRRTTLVHAVSHAEELVFADRVERWRRAGLDLDYRPTVSRPEDPRNRDWTGEVGRAEALLVRTCSRSSFQPGAVVAYVCGNPFTVEACRDVFRRSGVPGHAVRVETF